MADVLKGIDGVNLTADEMKSEAQRQAAANEAMDAINLTKETLHNVTIGNAEERRKAAVAAGQSDNASTGGKLAKDNFKLPPKKHWYDIFLPK